MSPHPLSLFASCQRGRLIPLTLSQGALLGLGWGGTAEALSRAHASSRQGVGTLCGFLEPSCGPSKAAYRIRQPQRVDTLALKELPKQPAEELSPEPWGLQQTLAVGSL